MGSVTGLCFLPRMRRPAVDNSWAEGERCTTPAAAGCTAVVEGHCSCWSAVAVQVEEEEALAVVRPEVVQGCTALVCFGDFVVVAVQAEGRALQLAEVWEKEVEKPSA